MEEIKLLDIADDLLIINKITIDRLFNENNQNALVLYLFYYKTAKWQKTNPIKANDEYCKKCLHWGTDKLKNAKAKLKEMKLIETIRKTDDKGIVVGWYLKINYLVDKSRIPETTIPASHQVADERQILNNNNKVLNNNININNINNHQKNFEELWKLYPNKKGKKDAYKHFLRAIKKGVSLETIQEGLQKYITYIEVEQIKPQYIKHGSTWFNQECWNDDYTITRKITTKDLASKIDYMNFLKE